MTFQGHFFCVKSTLQNALICHFSEQNVANSKYFLYFCALILLFCGNNNFLDTNYIEYEETFTHDFGSRDGYDLEPQRPYRRD